jgi:hypothetical protein
MKWKVRGFYGVLCQGSNFYFMWQDSTRRGTLNPFSVLVVVEKENQLCSTSQVVIQSKVSSRFMFCV